MRARRALRCLTLNHLFLVLFVASLYVFWRNGFRQRHPEDDEFDSAQDVGGSGTGMGHGRSSHNGSSAKSEDASRELHIEHPIPRLMEEAEKKFSAKLARQSKTLEDAVVEYRRRYNMEPPLGFDEWWDFAQKFQFKMLDEFDILMEDMAPFYGLPGVEVRRRVDQVGQLPSIDLVRVRDGVITVQNMKKGFKDSETSARARGFRSMMGKFARYLPDMDFPINAKAEGRVLIPWEHQQYPNLTRRDSSGGVEDMLGGPFNPDWGTDGNSWEAWRRTCHPNTTSRRLYSSLRDPFVVRQKNYLLGGASPPAGEDFEFAGNTAVDFDFCQHPHEHYNQGHFFTDWRSIPVLYPVFSPARAKGYMDVRIPSHYYYGSTKGYTYGWDFEKKVLTPVDKMEKPWDDKIDKIFWRGATTGGGSHPPGFSPQYHRHRFLRMASDKSNSTRVVTFKAPNTTHWESIEMPISTLNDDIMDAAFVKVSGLYPGGLSALMEKHRFSEPVPLGKHWSYKYLVDLDGMSYSGRFMSFLASDSVPIKATVYSEFFSDWIEPWLHFIPLSPSYKEIYNVFTYFHGPTQGVLEAVNSTLASLPQEERKSFEDERLRKIAMAGKEWKKTMARTLDMEVYVYRLCLEWARLWADDRESMNYVP